MIPVDQNKFDYPEGNCLMACIASIIEVELCDLPDLFERCTRQDENGIYWDNADWWDVVLEGLAVHGWEARAQVAVSDDYWPDGYAIAAGPTGRAFDENGNDVGHCIVCLDGIMVHDPHPDRTGLQGLTEEWYLLNRKA